jgi:PAS domain S-box-containing protein
MTFTQNELLLALLATVIVCWLLVQIRDRSRMRRHYQRSLDELPVGVCSLGQQGRIQLWNHRMEQITELRGKSTVGLSVSSLPQPWQEVLEVALQIKPDNLGKREILDLHGRHRWISVHSGPPLQGSGDRLILVEDITNYQRLQDEVLHNERLASLGRLAAGVAHEIGNPITGISSLAQNLAYARDPAEIEETADEILKQTERVSRIVESLVNFSHTGSRAGDLKLQSCNLADCIDEAIHLLQLDRDAKEIRFINHCDRELLVTADSQRLLQVFINLLGNARDASAELNEVAIDASATEEGFVCIRVDDEGHGIPPETLDRVFEPFFTTKEVGSGTGLGLALVYSIMEDMQGQIRLQSPVPESDRGTRAELRLPAGDYSEAYAA